MKIGTRASCANLIRHCTSRNATPTSTRSTASEDLVFEFAWFLCCWLLVVCFLLCLFFLCDQGRKQTTTRKQDRTPTMLPTTTMANAKRQAFGSGKRRAPSHHLHHRSAQQQRDLEARHRRREARILRTLFSRWFDRLCSSALALQASDGQAHNQTQLKTRRDLRRAPRTCTSAIHTGEGTFF